VCNIVEGKLHGHYKKSNIFIIIYLVLFDSILNEEWNKLGFERAIVNNKYCSMARVFYINFLSCSQMTIVFYHSVMHG